MGMNYAPSKANIITNTAEQTGRFVKIHALADSEVTLVSESITENGSTTVNGITMNASTTIEGLMVTSITLASGQVIAYEA
jgi:hypothetical protein